MRPGHLWRCPPTLALCVCVPRQLGRFSGRVPTRGFRYGTQATDWGMHPLGRFVTVHPDSQAADQVAAQPGFQVWAPSPVIWVHANWASVVCWGCLSCVHSPGAEGIGAQEATAAAESSLTSR